MSQAKASLKGALAELLLGGLDEFDKGADPSERLVGEVVF